MTINRLFDTQARARIAAAVKAGEAKTRGQIVPVVVARSRDYHGFQRGLGVLAPLLGLQLGLALWFPNRFDVSAQMILATIGAWVGLCALPFVRRRSESGDFHAAVHERALASFIHHGVHETHEGTGVLIFASLYERQVVILGDRAIHAKMGDDGWRAAVDRLIAGLGDGRAADGFCEAIALVGERLAEHFPRQAGENPNELSDELRIERE